MITALQAQEIINNIKLKSHITFCAANKSLGKILAENIVADRDFPPFNRVTMDGIAINFESINNNNFTFFSTKIQFAGHKIQSITETNECIEVMTGCLLPMGCNTVIRYEDIEKIENNGNKKIFQIKNIIIKEGQNIHYQGSDKLKGEIILSTGKSITAVDLALIASVGIQKIKVVTNPTIAIIATGDELVTTKSTPKDYQIRVSNSIMIQAALANINITSKVFMCKDNPEKLTTLLANSLKQYELIIITGAVSMGKSDYIPSILNKLAVQNLFHGVLQRPAKPLWFGKSKQGNIVFAMPGNPVSATVCTYVYLLPWLNKLGLTEPKTNYAKLNEEVIFKPALTYYLQVKICNNQHGELLATPITGNGSGDLTNLTKIDAFMELPANQTTFLKGEVYRVFYLK